MLLKISNEFHKLTQFIFVIHQILTRISIDYLSISFLYINNTIFVNFPWKKKIAKKSYPHAFRATIQVTCLLHEKAIHEPIGFESILSVTESSSTASTKTKDSRKYQYLYKNLTQNIQFDSKSQVTKLKNNSSPLFKKFSR